MIKIRNFQATLMVVLLALCSVGLDAGRSKKKPKISYSIAQCLGNFNSYLDGRDGCPSTLSWAGGREQVVDDFIESRISNEYKVALRRFRDDLVYEVERYLARTKPISDDDLDEIDSSSRGSASVASEGPSDSVNASNGLEEGYFEELEGHRFSDGDSDGIDSSSRGSASGVADTSGSSQSQESYSAMNERLRQCAIDRSERDSSASQHSASGVADASGSGQSQESYSAMNERLGQCAIDRSERDSSASQHSASGVEVVPASDQLSDKVVEQGAQRKGAPGRESLVKTDPASRYSSKLALVSSLVFILSLGREVLKLRGLSITRKLQLGHEGSDVELVPSWSQAVGLAAKRIFTAKRSEAKLVRLATILFGSTVAWAAIQNS